MVLTPTHSDLPSLLLAVLGVVVAVVALAIAVLALRRSYTERRASYEIGLLLSMVDRIADTPSNDTPPIRELLMAFPDQGKARELYAYAMGNPNGAPPQQFKPGTDKETAESQDARGWYLDTSRDGALNWIRDRAREVTNAQWAGAPDLVEQDDPRLKGAPKTPWWKGLIK